jgi:hypothetical protein
MDKKQKAIRSSKLHAKSDFPTSDINCLRSDMSLIIYHYWIFSYHVWLCPIIKIKEYLDVFYPTIQRIFIR